MRRVRRNHQKLWLTLFACLGVLGALGAAQTCGLFNARDTYLAQTLAYADEIADPSRQAADEVEVIHDTETRIDSGERIDLSSIYWENDMAYAELSDGRRARLTLDRALQTTIENSLTEHTVPHGGAVAIDPKTGIARRPQLIALCNAGRRALGIGLQTRHGGGFARKGKRRSAGAYLLFGRAKHAHRIRCPRKTTNRYDVRKPRTSDWAFD